MRIVHKHRLKVSQASLAVVRPNVASTLSFVSEPQGIGELAQRMLFRVERPSLVLIKLAQFRQHAPRGFCRSLVLLRWHSPQGINRLRPAKRSVERQTHDVLDFGGARAEAGLRTERAKRVHALRDVAFDLTDTEQIQVSPNGTARASSRISSSILSPTMQRASASVSGPPPAPM